MNDQQREARIRELMQERDALDENWSGALDDPHQQAVRAAWDATPKGRELFQLLRPLSTPAPRREEPLREVWYVAGADTDLQWPMLWASKLDAEQYARALFPEENIDQRFARVFCRKVYSFKENHA